MKKYLLLIGVFLIAGLTVNAQVNVTFTVDMSIYAGNGTFKPATDTVRIAGDFNDWNTSATDLAAGSGADSMKYSATVSITGSSAAYKFLFTSTTVTGGLKWEDGFPTSSGNREATFGASDTTLPVVYFNGITGKLNHVVFTVDMSGPIKQGKVTPGVTNVYLAGDMTNWGTSAKLMDKGATDSVYSVIVDSLASGHISQFKFVYSASDAASGSWEDNFSTDNGNRQWMVPEKDSSVFFDYWNGQNPNVQTGNGDINFTLDMSVLIKSGIFDPSKDSVLLSGGFNGWTTTDPNAFLTQNIVNDSSYFITYTFSNEPLGAKPYKYVVKIVNPTGIDTIWKDGYERPTHWGGGNRLTLFNGDASKDTTDYYDNVHPDWFIPSGTNLQVKFSVNMLPAMDAGKQAVPFVPSEDTLYWLSEEPAFARTQGWYRPSDGHMKILKMTAENDSIWSGTLSVKDPAFNAFEYRYEWQKGSDKSWVTEPSGFDAFAYRVRYVGQDKANSFPVNPWTMPTDTWTNNNLKTDQETDPYTSLVVGVTDKNIMPNRYSLSQNYPNPFNPSTKIDFSIQKPGIVTLKIYNILGQQVATLVNKEMQAGTYTYNFDASRLSSGVYFFSIKAGDFAQTKKMILLK